MRLTPADIHSTIDGTRRKFTLRHGTFKTITGVTPVPSHPPAEFSLHGYPTSLATAVALCAPRVVVAWSSDADVVQRVDVSRLHLVQLVPKPPVDLSSRLHRHELGAKGCSLHQPLLLRIPVDHGTIQEHYVSSARASVHAVPSMVRVNVNSQDYGLAMRLWSIRRNRLLHVPIEPFPADIVTSLHHPQLPSSLLQSPTALGGNSPFGMGPS
eukprot:CAMPEP_0116557942 /NCGR_PEP_ID=MMETSP0397-20121206/9531_1 /TAXON_ID=216820 /ORGANISM="Cyclophora tenuis, Strain ECT3854" /LENGTH=211 /DNA_ID=CAMNT_0004083477 /DNA_START=114 /DNA_END=750 /DNA_ORIENTATION=-